MAVSEVFGLVLDITSVQSNSGKRLIDEVRRHLIEAQKTDKECGLYLYHQALSDFVYQQSERVSVIANYETDGYRLPFINALVQTLYVLAKEDVDKKTLILITDRFSRLCPKDLFGIHKIVSINDKMSFGCKLVVLGIGEDRNGLNTYDVEYVEVTENTIKNHISYLFKEQDATR